MAADADSEIPGRKTSVLRAPPAIAPPGGDGGKGYLVRLYPPGSATSLIEIPARRFVLGRGHECDLELASDEVSREHAAIEPRAEHYVIADLGSTNGTYVNDVSIGECCLATGDRIRIGGHIIKFLTSGDIEAQYHETIYSLMVDDPLTGIRNRRFLLEALQRELTHSQRHHRPLALVLFDLDHFKEINDTYGHVTGDSVLREVCRRISEAVRGDEVFARFGGEEFVVLLPETQLAEAVLFAERIRQLVAQRPVVVDEREIPVTISAGVAHTNGQSGLAPEELIRQADEKLYAAKRLGRNRVES